MYTMYTHVCVRSKYVLNYCILHVYPMTTITPLLMGIPNHWNHMRYHIT